ncbi:hypothetical protein GCM10012319_61230 [Comamonas sp. KCTC 72670]|nr:hypothetical protein GCM10012319_61230 [Comamonas sp. KCTC 72670]
MEQRLALPLRELERDPVPDGGQGLRAGRLVEEPSGGAREHGAGLRLNREQTSVLAHDAAGHERMRELRNERSESGSEGWAPAEGFERHVERTPDTAVPAAHLDFRAPRGARDRAVRDLRGRSDGLRPRGEQDFHHRQDKGRVHDCLQGIHGR